MACSPGSGSTWRLSAACRKPYGALPTNSSFDFLCRIASRVRSPMASRSHWLTETMILSKNLTEAEPVSNDSATETSETPRRWNCSSRTAKSFTDRVSRSSLATITIPTARDWTISRMRTMPGRSRSLALSPASTKTSRSSTSWTVAIARIFSTCASSETPRSACLSVDTRTYPIPFVFIFQKKLDHTSGGSHKLPGYRFPSTSVWETPSESRRGSAPLAHGQQPGPSAKVSGRPAVSRWCWWAARRGNHACRGFRLWAGGGSGECAQTPHTGKVQQGRAATPATPATTFSPTKRGAGNSPARRRERYRAWDLALSYGPRRRETLQACLWDGGGWPPPGAGQDTGTRQQEQLVHRNLAAVLVIRGGWSGCFGTDAPCLLRYAYHKEKTMTNRLLLGTLLLFAGTGFAAQTWTGKISDSDCGAKHKSAAEHGGKAMSDHDCAVACVKGGAKYVFVTGGKVHPINNQDFSGLEEHAGHTVELTGDLQSQGGINVTGVQITSAKKKMAEGGTRRHRT